MLWATNFGVEVCLSITSHAHDHTTSTDSQKNPVDTKDLNAVQGVCFVHLNFP
jgi:hypothetical protein